MNDPHAGGGLLQITYLLLRLTKEETLLLFWIVLFDVAPINHQVIDAYL